MWGFVHRALEASPEKWRDLRSRSIAALETGNLAKGALRVQSDYLLVKATRT